MVRGYGSESGLTTDKVKKADVLVDAVDEMLGIFTQSFPEVVGGFLPVTADSAGSTAAKALMLLQNYHCFRLRGLHSAAGTA